MYKRDVVVVVLSFLGLFLCLQHEGNFSFRKAWYHVTLHDSDTLEVLQDRLEDLPAPIVADLNGDGHLEVIIATHDYKLELVRPEPPGRAGEGFAPVQVVRSFSLIPHKVLLGRDRRPVAMAVGFIDPEPAERVRALRKQVLVVVTASWQVLCFDHNLSLLWEVPVEDKLPHNARIAQVAVIITPHQVRYGQRGLVLVGGALQLGDVAGAATGEAQLGDLIGGGGGSGSAAADGKAAGGAGGGEGQLLESVLREELRFEAEEAATAHGGAGVTGRGDAVHPAHGLQRGSDGDAAAGDVDVSRHFSYYAFAGGSGESVWKHTSDSFRQEAVEGSADELRPQHDYRMRADALAGRHYGEMSCRDFREGLLAVLPQGWAAPRDTAFEEALFVRHKEGAGQQKAQLARLAAAKAAAAGRGGVGSLHPRKQRPAGFSLGHVLHPAFLGSSGAARSAGSGGRGGSRGLVASKHAAAADALSRGQAGMAQRHAHLAYNASTNALVAHMQDGLEVVHIYSGRTLCKLHLAPSQLHADINGDGVIDHVAVGSAGSGAAGPLGVAHAAHHAPLGPCTATASSGIPPRHTLWRAHVCAPHHNLGAVLDGGADGEEAAHVQFAPPVFLPVPRADGSYSHLRGQHGLVLLLSDDGGLQALNGAGQKLWHHFFDVAWDADGDGADGRGAHVGSGRAARGEAPAVPTLTPIALRPRMVPSAVLAVGSQGGAVVSEHGNELASFAVAFPPVAPAVVADFDGDGLQDVIIVTRGGVFGYAQVQHLGGLAFGALLLTLIGAMGVVWYSQQYEGPASGAGAGGWMLLGGGPGGGGGGAVGAPGSRGAAYGAFGGSAASGQAAAARARKLRSTEYVD